MQGFDGIYRAYAMFVIGTIPTIRWSFEPLTALSVQTREGRPARFRTRRPSWSSVVSVPQPVGTIPAGRYLYGVIDTVIETVEPFGSAVPDLGAW